jgi:ribonuclease HI
MAAWRLYFDGGARGNPGPAAAAWVLYDPDGTEVERWNQVLGIATNNVAEYSACVAGLTRAVELQVDDLQLYGDSELIIKQLRGEYKVKHPDMKRLHSEAVALLAQISTFTIGHVYRSDNAVADALVNEALDARGTPT